LKLSLGYDTFLGICQNFADFRLDFTFPVPLIQRFYYLYFMIQALKMFYLLYDSLK